MKLLGGIMDLAKKIYKLLDEDIIYHYTKSDTAFLYILKNGTLKTSYLKNTNDPIEYKPQHSSSFFSDEKFRNKSIEIRGKIKKMRSETRFISFCEDKGNNNNLRNEINNKHIENFYLGIENIKFIRKLGCVLPRMWTQYGDKHKGVCLAFSRKELKKEIEKKTNEYKFEEIEYREFPVIKSSALVTNLIGLSPKKIDSQEYAKKFISENYKELFFKKHNDYRDENECRLIINYDKENDFEYINIKSSLKAIIFGDNFNKNKYESLRNKFEKKYDLFSCDINWGSGTMILR
jgi:hypothetical protein